MTLQYKIKLITIKALMPTLKGKLINRVRKMIRVLSLERASKLLKSLLASLLENFTFEN